MKKETNPRTPLRSSQISSPSSPSTPSRTSENPSFHAPPSSRAPTPPPSSGGYPSSPAPLPPSGTNRASHPASTPPSGANRAFHPASTPPSGVNRAFHPAPSQGTGSSRAFHADPSQNSGVDRAYNPASLPPSLGGRSDARVSGTSPSFQTPPPLPAHGLYTPPADKRTPLPSKDLWKAALDALSPVDPRARAKNREETAAKIDAARKALFPFAVALKKLALYLHQNAGLEEFFGNILQGILQYHQTFGEDLTIQIKPFDLLKDDESIFRDETQESSFVYKLYRVGIRTLSFEQGLRAESLVEFGKILIKPPNELVHEDIATLLWKADLPCISYLLLQSSQESQDGYLMGDGEADVDALLAQLESQLHSADPRNLVSFRSIFTGDLSAAEAVQSADTQRSLQQNASPLSDRELQTIQNILQKEKEGIASKGSEVMFFLLKQIHTHEEFSKFQEHLTSLCQNLLFQLDFRHLALLLEELFWLEGEIRPQDREAFLLLRKQLFLYLSSEESLVWVVDFLESTPDLAEDLRRDILLFWGFLGSRVHQLCLQSLFRVSPPTRRFFVAVLAQAEKNQAFVHELLQHSSKEPGLLHDLLVVARDFPRLLKIEQIQSFLSHKDSQVQTEAFLLLAHHHADALPAIARPYLYGQINDLLHVALRALALSGPQGIAVILDFLKSKEFFRLSKKQQSSVFQTLGTVQNDRILIRLCDLLAEPSRWWRFRLNRLKLLAIEGLLAAGRWEDRIFLQRIRDPALQTSFLLREIDNALMRFPISLPPIAKENP